MSEVINGVILLDKITGISSNRALQQVKKLFNAKKAGHTGSLDPLASGILPICMGHSTKISQFLLAADKTYLASGKLGQQTNTADSEGEVIKTQACQDLTAVDIENILPSFLGDGLQIPPMFSALKKDGKPLYKLARQGINIKREPRQIHIFELQLLSFESPTFSIKVRCSKGTYIRTLIEDIAAKINNIAHTTSLRRVGFAHYDISQTVGFEALSAASAKSKYLLPAESVLLAYQSVRLDQKQAKDLQFGRQITYNLDLSTTSNLIKLFAPDQQFLGIGTYQNGIISPKRLFIG